MYEFMSDAEKNFWERADAVVGGIDMLVRVILSANRFSQFGSFKNVNATDELLEEIVNRIRSLNSKSKYYEVIKELSEINPEEFVLFAGSKANLKNVFLELNKLEITEFEQQQQVEILVIDDQQGQEVQKSIKRSLSSTGESTSRKKKRQEIRLDDDKHLEVLKNRVRELMLIANPLLDFEEINLSFVLSKSTEHSITYRVPCFACNNRFSVSAYITPAGHLKYRIDSLTNHLENSKVHPEEAARIKDKKDIFWDEEDSEIITEIKLKLKKHPRLYHEIKVLLKSYDSPKDSDMFYNYLYESSLTYRRGSTSNKFDDYLLPLKQFSTYLYLKGGYGLYDSLYMNAPMPSTSVIKQEIQRGRMEPCKIYSKELRKFLDKHNLPRHVIVAEDATRILSRVELDSQTNELFGLLPPMDEKTGMPSANFFKLNKPSNMQTFINNYESAPYIQVIVAKPFKLDCPSMVIGTFPTNNAYTSSNVKSRWNFIADELEKFDISCSFSSDGDPRLLAGMKLLTNFGNSYHIPELDVNLLCNMKSKNKCIQDSIHLANKLKNCLFDTANDIELGEYLATVNHIRIMVDCPNVMKDQHQLTNSDINANDSTRDKMNSESTRKICTTEVIKLIKEHVSHSDGTVAYLQLIRSIYEAFIELNVDPVDRLYHAYYAISFIRIWRNNVTSSSNNFITYNAWTSIELNFAFLLQLVLNGKGHLIVISNSQCCEELFRTLRSLSTFGLTEINFSLLECLEKINRVKKIQEISFDLKDIFRLRENIDRKSDKTHRQNVPMAEPGTVECKLVLKEAFKEAKSVCQRLKMKNLNPCDPQKYLKKAQLSSSCQTSIILDTDEDNFLKIKNAYILNVESDSQYYKLVTEDGDVISEIKKSYVLWLLQDEKAKLSTDRMVRFREGRREKTVERVQSDSSFFVDKAVVPGDYLCLKTNEKEAVCIFGQVVKFQYLEGSSKKEKRYPFSNVIIDLNKNVSIRLLPCYYMNRRGMLKSCADKYFDISCYVCTVRTNVFNFDSNRLFNRYLLILKEKFPSLF